MAKRIGVIWKLNPFQLSLEAQVSLKNQGKIELIKREKIACLEIDWCGLFDVSIACFVTHHIPRQLTSFP